MNVLLAQLSISKDTRFSDRTAIRAVFMDEGFPELTMDRSFMVETLELN